MQKRILMMWLLVASLCFGGCWQPKAPAVTPVTPIVTPAAQGVDVWVEVWDGGTPAAKVPTASVVLDGHPPKTLAVDANGNAGFLNEAPGARHIWVTAAGFKDFDQHIEIAPTPDQAGANGREMHIPVTLLPLVPPAPPVPAVRARTGVVRAAGRHFSDDQGRFYPLGATLFWGVRGWKYEPDRVRQNLKFLAAHRWDYIRILGEVGWSGNSIDPRWPDYETVLGGLIDAAYDDYGLRVELTLIGGGTGADYKELARKIVAVVKPRAHKVLSLEVSNEFQIFDADLQNWILQYLRANLPNLVAATDATSSGLSEVEAAGTKRYIAAGATYASLHLDRDQGKVDWMWRHVRQTWDYKALPFPISHNEPGGPRSSVAEFVEPIHLVMSRAVGILNGVEGYVLHNGAGVAGRVDPARNRPANLWEVPGIDQIMVALRKVDTWVPANVSDGAHGRHGLGGPLTADNIWPDGGDHGVVRDYQVDLGTGFVSMPFGIKNYVVMTAARAADLSIIDPVTGETETRTVAAGEQIRLEPKSRDSRGYGAFIILGAYR